jgi:microcystin-dependent protein
MNKLILNQAGGQKLIREDLAFMDNAYRDAFKGLTSAFGDNFILSGCDLDQFGVAISAGQVVINGEICEVDAQILATSPPAGQNYWRVEEVVTVNRLHDDGNLYPIRAARKASVVRTETPEQTWVLFSSVKRVNSILQDIATPAGIIQMWSGTISTIPSGWSLCNGSNGTPDLRNRFIVGAGSDANNNTYYKTGGGANTTNSKYNGTGGVDEVTLTSAQSGVPPHNHPVTPSGGQLVTGSSSISTESGANGFAVLSTSTAAVGNNTAQDAAEAHENRPPYYALAYIMKL